MHVKGFVMFVFFQILRQKLDNENNCTAEKEKKNQKMKTSSVTLVRIMFDWPEARKHV